MNGEHYTSAVGGKKNCQYIHTNLVNHRKILITCIISWFN